MSTHRFPKKWILIEAEAGDGSLLIRQNQAAAPMHSHPEYRHQLGVAVPLRAPNQLGFPDRPEGQELKAIEAALVEELEYEKDSILALVITGGSAREYVFYTRTPSNVEARVRKAALQVTTHRLQSAVQLDPDWSVYDRFSA